MPWAVLKIWPWSQPNSTLTFRERNNTTKRHSCTQNLLAVCTTTSFCACLNSSHLLFPLQICTSFQADLELSKIEHRLEEKFYLEKKRGGGGGSVICFQLPIFSSNCNSSASVLFIYWHSCRKGKEWPICPAVCFPRKYSIAFTACQPCFPEVQSCGTTIHTADMCPYSLEQCSYLMCVFACVHQKGWLPFPTTPQTN